MTPEEESSKWKGPFPAYYAQDDPDEMERFFWIGPFDPDLQEDAIIYTFSDRKSELIEALKD